MLRISKLTDYSTVVMTYLAQAPDKVHNAREITQYTHIALPTVSKILKILAKGGLLESHRGAAGGYSLACAPKDISIANIVSVMEGDVGLTGCSHANGQCELEQECAISHQWRSISHMLHELLSNINLAQMSQSLPHSVRELTQIQEKDNG